MASGDKRMLSARRGMTVLGKIPAVPKPINLPSQRLENRGLDPNVEIVPRGTMSWGTTGRSPPVGASSWGNPTLASSPPVSTGSWSTVVKEQGSSVSQHVTGGLAKSPARPSSADGMRPSSAPATSNRIWGGAAKPEERPQSSHFNLTHVDFPTLGSEKNPNLRPQHGAVLSNRPTSADGNVADKDRLLAHGDRPTSADGRVSDKERLLINRDTVQANRPTSADTNFPYKERRPIYTDVGEHGVVTSPGDYGRYADPGDHDRQPPFVRREMAQMDSHMAPAGMGMRLHQSTQYGYYRPPGAPQFNKIEGSDINRGIMVGSPSFSGSYPQLGPSIQFGRPGIYEYHPHRVPPENYSRQDQAGGQRPNNMHLVTSHDAYGRGIHTEGGHEHGMHRDDWFGRAPRDVGNFGMPRDESVNILSLSTPQANLGPKGVNANGKEPSESSQAIIEDDALPTGAVTMRLAGKVPPVQSIPSMETSTHSIGMIRAPQNHNFQGSGHFREQPNARMNFLNLADAEQEQLKERGEWRNHRRIVTSREGRDASNINDTGGVKEVYVESVNRRSEVMIIAMSPNHAKSNTSEASFSAISSDNKKDSPNYVSKASGDVRVGTLYDPNIRRPSILAAKGQRQSAPLILEKQPARYGVTGPVSNEAQTKVFSGQGGSLPSVSLSGRNASQDQVSRKGEGVGDTHTSRASDTMWESRRAYNYVDSTSLPKVIQAERKGTPESKNQENQGSRQNHEDRNVNKLTDTKKGAVDLACNAIATGETVVSPRLTGDNTERDTPSEIAISKPPLILSPGLAGHESEASSCLPAGSKIDILGIQPASPNGKSSNNGSKTTYHIELSGRTGKKGRKSSHLKVDEAGNMGTSKIAAIEEKDEDKLEQSSIKHLEPQACEVSPVIFEDGQVNDEIDPIKVVRRKQNPPRRAPKDRSFHEPRNGDRSSTSEGLVWAPVRNLSRFESGRKEDGVRTEYAETPDEAKLPPSKMAQLYAENADEGQGREQEVQHPSPRSIEQEQGVIFVKEGSLPQEPQEPPSLLSTKVSSVPKTERRKSKGDSGVYVPKPLRREQQYSAGSTHAQTIERRSVEEPQDEHVFQVPGGVGETPADEGNLNKDEIESRACKPSRQVQVQHQASYRAKRWGNSREKSSQNVQEDQLPILVDNNPETSRNKVENASDIARLAFTQEHLQLQNPALKGYRGQGQFHRSGRIPPEEQAEQPAETTVLETSKHKLENKAYVPRQVRQQLRSSASSHEAWGQERRPDHLETKKNKEEVTPYVPKHRQQQHSLDSNQGHKQARSFHEKGRESVERLVATEPETCRDNDENKPKPVNEHQTQRRQHAPNRHQKQQLLHNEDEILPEDQSYAQISLPTLENDAKKTPRPQSGASSHRVQRQKKESFSNEGGGEQTAESGGDLADIQPEPIKYKDESNSESSNNKEEMKRYLPKAIRQQQSASSSQTGQRSYPKEQWEPVHISPTPAVSVPEPSKRKGDMKIYTPKPFRQQQMQQQQSAANTHEDVVFVPPKERPFEEQTDGKDSEKDHTSRVKNQSRALKTDGVGDDDVSMPSRSSEMNMQGWSKDQPKDAGSSVPTYWRKHESGQRQHLPLTMDHHKQQVYVRKATEPVIVQPSSNDGGQSSAVVKPSVALDDGHKQGRHNQLEGQSSRSGKQREQWSAEGIPEGVISSRQVDDGRGRFPRHENAPPRRGRFQGHRSRIVDHVS